MNAEALNCPNCGAGITSDRTSCPFCRTRLKTIACSRCLGMMFVGNEFCGHCGARSATEAVSVSGDKGGKCPRCKTHLTILEIENNSVGECSKCDGIWLSAETFERICERTDEAAAVIAHFDRRFEAASLVGKVRYVPCPTCGDLMNRSNFGRMSGVIVDICKQHGVWLDRGELDGVVHFIREGGLEKARQREKSDIADERSRIRLDQSQAAIQARRFASDDPGSTSFWTMLRRFLES